MDEKGNLKILAIETTCKIPSISLLENDSEIDFRIGEENKTSSKNLLSEIAEMLHSKGLQVSELDLIAVSSGPGSYTGLKVGLSTVKGLVIGTNIRLVGISTLEAFAYFKKPQLEIRTVISAGREEYFSELFLWNEEIYNSQNQKTEKKDIKVLLEDVTLSQNTSIVCDETTYTTLQVISNADICINPQNTAKLVGQAAFRNIQKSSAGMLSINPVYL